MAVVADIAVLVAFVAIGRRSHEAGSDLEGFFGNLGPFLVGLGVAAATTGVYRAPLAFRRAVPAWLLTVAVGVPLRLVVLDRSFSATFALVAALFIGACMLGWRATVIGVAHGKSARAT